MRQVCSDLIVMQQQLTCTVEIMVPLSIRAACARPNDRLAELRTPDLAVQ